MDGGDYFVVVSLNHFCEIHGPRIVFSTEFLEGETCNSSEQISSLSGTFPKRTSTSRPVIRVNPCCSSIMGCFRSVTVSGEFISRREPRASLYSALQNACLRSLSCEDVGRSERPAIFGDEEKGVALFRKFRIRDGDARGGRRYYSLVVLARGPGSLAHMASTYRTLSYSLLSVSSSLQYVADIAYNQRVGPADVIIPTKPVAQYRGISALHLRSGASFPQSPIDTPSLTPLSTPGTSPRNSPPMTPLPTSHARVNSLTPLPALATPRAKTPAFGGLHPTRGVRRTPFAAGQCQGHGVPLSSLSSLVKDSSLFFHVHDAFCSILRDFYVHCLPQFPEESASLPSPLDERKRVLKSYEPDHGFQPAPVRDDGVGGGADQDTTGSPLSFVHDCSMIKTFTSLAPARADMQSLLWHILIGDQVIVRCNDQTMTNSIIHAIRFLVPDRVMKVCLFSTEYHPPWEFSVLGCPRETDVPSDIERAVRIDITLSGGDNGMASSGDGSLPLSEVVVVGTDKGVKLSVIVKEYVRILTGRGNDATKFQLLISEKAKVDGISHSFFHFVHKSNITGHTRSRFLKAVGLSDQDEPILRNWTTGLKGLTTVGRFN